MALAPSIIALGGGGPGPLAPSPCPPGSYAYESGDGLSCPGSGGPGLLVYTTLIIIYQCLPRPFSSPVGEF